MTDKVERGLQARAILEEGVGAEALANLEQAYIAQWRAAKTPEARENLHRLLTLIDQFKADLRSVIITGDIEAVKRQEEQPKRSFWQTKNQP